MDPWNNLMNLTFILVEPSVPENIGATARAIKTMGFRSLRLVNPPNYPHEKALHVAHASHDILSQATLTGTLEEALIDVDFAVATTAKRRSVKYDFHHAEELPEILSGKARSVQHAAIVFGREESGLTNREIALCDLVSYLPMRNKYPSLNLSHAVMLYAYILSGFSRARGRKTRKPVEGKYLILIELVNFIMTETQLIKNRNIRDRIYERLALLDDSDINLLLSALVRIRAHLS